MIYINLVWIIFLIAVQLAQSQQYDELMSQEQCNKNSPDLDNSLYKIEYELNALNSTLSKQWNSPNITINFQFQPNTPNNDIQVYNNYQLNSQFDKSLWNRACCSSPDLYNYKFNKSERPALRIGNLEYSSDVNVRYTIQTQFTHGLNPNLVYKGIQPHINQSTPVTIKKGEEATFAIQVACPKDMDLNNYWTALDINFNIATISQDPNAPTKTQNIQVYYFFVCDQKYRPVKYAVSLTILTIILSVIVFFMAIYSTPQSIVCYPNFDRFEIKWYHSSIYALLIIMIAVLNTVMNHNLLEKLMDILMAVVTAASSWFFLNEMQCSIKSIQLKVERKLFQVYIFTFQLMDIISIVISAILVFFWIFTGKTWYLSDILAVFLLGSLMKLLKFNSLKQAFLFLSICLLVDSVGGLIVYIREALSYDIIFINQYNEPFLISMPSINVLYDKFCSWLPVTGTAFPGILMNYCYQYDKNQRQTNTKAFTYLSLFGYVLGSSIYMIVATFNIHTWPYSLLNYPLMCLFIFLFAYKRSEHLILWNGGFFKFNDKRKTILVTDSEDVNGQFLYDGLRIMDSVDYRETSDGQRDRKSKDVSINNEGM